MDYYTGNSSLYVVAIAPFETKASCSRVVPCNSRSHTITNLLSSLSFTPLGWTETTGDITLNRKYDLITVVAVAVGLFLIDTAY